MKLDEFHDLLPQYGRRLLLSQLPQWKWNWRGGVEGVYVVWTTGNQDKDRAGHGSTVVQVLREEKCFLVCKS